MPLLVSARANPQYPARDVTIPVSLLDITPTVLDLAGLPPFAQFEGVRLKDADDRRPVTVYFRTGQARIFRGWKLIDYDTRAPQTRDDMALYWLPGDPGETINLLAPVVKSIGLSSCITMRGCLL